MAFPKSSQGKIKHRLCMCAYLVAFVALLCMSRKRDGALHQQCGKSRGSKSVKAVSERTGVAGGMSTGGIYYLYGCNYSEVRLQWVTMCAYHTACITIPNSVSISDTLNIFCNIVCITLMRGNWHTTCKQRHWLEQEQMRTMLQDLDFRKKTACSQKQVASRRSKQVLDCDGILSWARPQVRNKINHGSNPISGIRSHSNLPACTVAGSWNQHTQM